MKSIEWIDRLISERSLPSDRQAALLLGMNAATMSQHRNGRSKTLDDVFAYRMEELLSVPHGKIVLDQHAEREKDPNISAMWRKLAATAAAIAVIFFQLNVGGNALPHLEINPLNSITYDTFTLVIIAAIYMRFE